MLKKPAQLINLKGQVSNWFFTASKLFSIWMPQLCCISFKTHRAHMKQCLNSTASRNITLREDIYQPPQSLFTLWQWTPYVARSQFIASFLYPTAAWLYVASVLVGLGAAVIWTAQGNYLTTMSEPENMSRNSGIFWAQLQCRSVNDDGRRSRVENWWMLAMIRCKWPPLNSILAMIMDGEVGVQADNITLKAKLWSVVSVWKEVELKSDACWSCTTDCWRQKPG